MNDAPILHGDALDGPGPAGPTYSATLIPALGAVDHRVVCGALEATAFSAPGAAPEAWVVTRYAPRARPRVERLTLTQLRHGGRFRGCRTLAAVIRAGLRGRL